VRVRRLAADVADGSLAGQGSSVTTRRQASAAGTAREREPRTPGPLAGLDVSWVVGSTPGVTRTIDALTDVGAGGDGSQPDDLLERSRPRSCRRRRRSALELRHRLVCRGTTAAPVEPAARATPALPGAHVETEALLLHDLHDRLERKPCRRRRRRRRRASRRNRPPRAAPRAQVVLVEHSRWRPRLGPPDHAREARASGHPRRRGCRWPAQTPGTRSGDHRVGTDSRSHPLRGVTPSKAEAVLEDDPGRLPSCSPGRRSGGSPHRPWAAPLAVVPEPLRRLGDLSSRCARPGAAPALGRLGHDAQELPEGEQQLVLRACVSSPRSRPGAMPISAGVRRTEARRGGVLHVEDRLSLVFCAPTGRGRCRSGCPRWSGRGVAARVDGRRHRRGPRARPRCRHAAHPQRLTVAQEVHQLADDTSRLTRGMSPKAAHMAWSRPT